MKQYEVTFIVDPVLSGDEIKATAQAYQDLIKNEGCHIVHMEDMGLRQLAYPLNKRNSGVYYCLEFQTDSGAVINKLELALRRDERIIRFLSVKLDKYGVKYNEDKRNGLIGKKVASTSARKDRGNRDDLQKIEGVGPKIAETLNTAGIRTYAQLASTTADRISNILSKAGGNLASHDPATWPKQADLAAKGKWNELKKWQDELVGGKTEARTEEE